MDVSACRHREACGEERKERKMEGRAREIACPTKGRKDWERRDMVNIQEERKASVLELTLGSEPYYHHVCR